ncbi:MAG: SemiSWEET family sugar transporter, partial [Microcystaceae cyanobacterium]
MISLLLLTGWGLICSEPSLAQATKAHNLPPWGVEAIGIVAGFGTTFSSVPDLIIMLRKRSTQGHSPRMAGICAVFQCLWLVYGFLLPSPSLIFWNIIA